MKQPPIKLSEITLSHWVGYQNMYGQALDQRLIEISRMPKGEDRTDAILLHDVDLMTQSYAYYTDTPLSEVIELGIVEVCKVMGEVFIAHKKEMIKLDVNAVFEWNSERWRMQPVHDGTTQLTKEQYETVTDVALIISDLQDGRHEALYDLCAAYLRHPAEAYSADLIEQRRELMMLLPLNIALCVKTYVENGIKEMLKN